MGTSKLSGMKHNYGITAPRFGILILVILGLPDLRSTMESDMVLHMLIQFPLIVFAGWLVAKGLSIQRRKSFQRWNYAGISGLLATSMVLMFWMLPRAIDLVLINDALEWSKFISLCLAGVALELSWKGAGMIVRGFFLGNVLPMMMVVGWLYIAAPVRICNSYLSSDQLRTGSGLLALAIAGSLVWLYTFFIPAEGERDEETKMNYSNPK